MIAMTNKLNVALLVALLATAICLADEYVLIRSSIDGGGAIQSTGDGFELSGTIGQPDAGPGATGMSGEGFVLTGGFWFPIVIGDCNTDGGVNLFDFTDFDDCASGPGGGLPEPGCACFDFDSDDDVDLLDFGAFQTTVQGI